MRLSLLILALAIGLLQYPLWLGKGGWFKVWETDRKLQAQRNVNRGLELRNAALDAQVRDLKAGTEAIEEQARFELGLVRKDEVFVEIPKK